MNPKKPKGTLKKLEELKELCETLKESKRLLGRVNDKEDFENIQRTPKVVPRDTPGYI